jgi:hypothetical protein
MVTTNDLSTSVRPSLISSDMPSIIPIPVEETHDHRRLVRRSRGRKELTRGGLGRVITSPNICFLANAMWENGAIIGSQQLPGRSSVYLLFCQEMYDTEAIQQESLPSEESSIGYPS